MVTANLPNWLRALCNVEGDAMSTDHAIEAGYDAYWDGVDPDDNPCKPETSEQRAWEEGWSQAQSEDDETDDA